MWRFKPFMPKEQAGLEGRTIDIGNLKVHVRNAIAEGGFSCVYLARDAINGSKQYAVKHIICNDEESMELVMKEISVMKSLRGHPNVVTLHANTIFDMGRTKETLLVMEYCDKSLVAVLESRGAGYFEEKQILAIFRDVCNAVFAMHCQTPPIAHRDLKAENLLLGSDGLWKLCDFGSVSTNHKRFEKPEEMGIEEDNIRKHTTPAYRSPEMWDLFRRELINEKVDIWALGCLLFRICYLKSAFDGESKLQILNGNYRIPELPKYSSSITDLIKNMLQSSPDARPDITQASALLDWPFISLNLVNSLLPDALQKSLPDRPPEMPQQGSDTHEGIPKPTHKTNPMPRRSPPPPPLTESGRNVSPAIGSRTSGGGGPLGAFWTSQHGKDTVVADENNRPKFDEPAEYSSSRHDKIQPERLHLHKTSHQKEEYPQSRSIHKNLHGRSVNRSEDGPSKDFEINFFQDESDHGDERSRASQSESTHPIQGDAFNAFVAEFGAGKLSPGSNSKKSGKEETLEAEIDRLKEQIKQANAEKAEITSKYEKLSAICRSQRQEIQELKQALTSRTPSPNRDASRNLISPRIHPSTTPSQKERIEGSAWEFQGSFEKKSTVLDTKPWQPFADDPKPQAAAMNNNSKSVRTRSGQQNKQAAEVTSAANTWGFGTESFTAVPVSSSRISAPVGEFNNSMLLDESKNIDSKTGSQPAGWAGF
ncbi:hypothetical protein RJ639_024251 [Escallonia herrerae]|uniref:non-specific serine/threonine protein kinase n=1 Tax=Escallonia herrerae TaxID=1293975 RepID=A0AA88UZE4_9ASTE|nr:hypothetical protein RJ639_024251 [Escallonia herrerae]